MVVVKKFGIFSTAKMSALVLAAVFFIFGLAGVVMFAFAPKEALPPEMSYTAVSLIGAWMLDTLLFAVFGFIGGVLWAVFYNLFAKLVGGFEIELEGEIHEKKKLGKK